MSRKLHDSDVKSINFFGENEISIKFIEEDGDPVFLEMKGVLFFFCEDMKERNIVFEFKANSFKLEKVRELISKKMNPDSKESAQYISQVESGQLNFLSVSSSYGAKVEVICESWKIQDIKKPAAA